MNSLSNFKLFSFSVKEQDEKTLSRTQEYVVMPSTRGRSWLFPNNTDLLTELTAKMFRHKTPYDAGYIMVPMRLLSSVLCDQTKNGREYYDHDESHTLSFIHNILFVKMFFHTNSSNRI